MGRQQPRFSPQNNFLESKRFISANPGAHETWHVPYASSSHSLLHSPNTVLFAQTMDAFAPSTLLAS
jgi:hypothetical protein